MLLNKNTHFISFLAGILKEFRLDLSQLFEYCKRKFVSVGKMADFAKLDLLLFQGNLKNVLNKALKNGWMKKDYKKQRFYLNFLKNVNEIANECAFSLVAWFIERFKDKYKQTPKQYQKSKNLYFLSKNWHTFFKQI